MKTARALKALKPGAKIAVLSPASTPPKGEVDAGVKALRALGYEPILYPHVLDNGPLYFAGTLPGRIDDLHRAFADPTIDAIHCSRGGYGSVELLPFLNSKLISENPKPMIGFSDITSLHIYLQNQCGLITFHGPMVASDFSAPNGVDLASWRHALEGDTNSSPDAIYQFWSVGPAEGMRVLQPGKASGILRGGCLSIIVAAIGTPFAPQFDNSILFIEDVNAYPYQVDRMIVQLRYALKLQKVRGIVFGIMKGSVDPKEALDARTITVENAILHALADFEGPIAFGLRSGHVNEHNVTLPLGVAVDLDLTDHAAPRLTFTQPSVV
jgi:muramoyltetrapeptide carboxypeptidase